MGEDDTSFVEHWIERVSDALAGAPYGEELHAAAAAAASAMGAQSIAILGAAGGADQKNVFLIAASDDPEIARLPLTLSKYPEVRQAMATGQPVAIVDVTQSELFGPYRDTIASSGIGSILVFPMMILGEFGGALLARFSERQLENLPELMRFGRQAARLFAVALREGQVLDPLREQTRRVSLEDMSRERRLRSLARYRDIIDSAADGVVVLDGTGRVLYMNHAAETLTGYARDGLAGRLMMQIVAERQREFFLSHVESAAKGHSVSSFDLDVITTSNEQLTVSMSSVGALPDDEAAIFAFRDVTVPRHLERELRHTKDFLERTLNSTVDAIVATDNQRRVCLFNHSAEQLFGYTAPEALGRLTSDDLFLPGHAIEVAQLLHSPAQGGSGRLQSVRRDVRNQSGEALPVALSAAVVFDDQRIETGTVFVFRDLRDRIKMEEKLATAQEKLAVSQKQALAVELAGAAAHELNQPLTSVMGYAEMLRKRLGPESPHQRFVETILQEAERMAGIVRQLGTLARYETKAYVGRAQIVDLGRSSSVTDDEHPRTPPPETHNNAMWYCTPSL